MCGGLEKGNRVAICIIFLDMRGSLRCIYTERALGGHYRIVRAIRLSLRKGENDRGA